MTSNIEYPIRNIETEVSTTTQYSLFNIRYSTSPMTEITARLSTALAERYQIESHLGEGGMANVYLADDLKHHRKVAVKVLRPRVAGPRGERLGASAWCLLTHQRPPGLAPLVHRWVVLAHM